MVDAPGQTNFFLIILFCEELCKILCGFFDGYLIQQRNPKISLVEQKKN
jgi:hypothetical protein